MTEILSPVGSYESFYAAINSGCDAIYLAGEAYGARKAITKFSLDDIKKMIEIAHKYRVKVYITINTLIFDDEIDEVIKYTDEIYKAGVDAILIQDMGLLNIFSKRYPSLDLHISTQANIKTLEEIKFFEKEKQVKRVVLARETPIEEIKRIKENTNLEIEVFVHGAICMGYSGNCLFSSMIFGRSGNRGECAQPCRLKYSLYEDDKLLDENKYLLSPKELCTIENVDELIKIGVDSFKIEGRIKSPEYVALTTSLYKEKVLNPEKNIKDIEIEKLKRAYNRDFTKGYLFDIKPSSIVNNFRPNNMGVYLGTVINNDIRLKIKIENNLERLDGIRIISNDKDDYGIVVDKIYKNNIEVNNVKTGDVIEIESYKMPRFKCDGRKVYITSSESLKEEFKDVIKEKINRHDIPLNLKIILKKGEYPVLLDLTSNKKVVGDFKVLEASNKPLSKDTIEAQLNKLQDTPYNLSSLDIESDDNVFVPLGVLNSLRRNLIEEIEDPKIDRIINEDIKFNKTNCFSRPELIIKVETYEQFEMSYSLGFRSYYVYGTELYELIKNNYNDVDIVLMLPRIINDYSKFSKYNNILINEVGSMNKSDVYLDSYLNITNIYSLNYYLKRGAKSITLSLEDKKDNVLNFVNRYKERFKETPSIEFVIYDKVDLMIMKYCLISGHYKTDVGCNICKGKTYKLKDRMDTFMDIITTDTCGNRILNSKTLSLFEYKDEIVNSGIKTLRINFTNESKEEVKKALDAYNKNAILKGLKYTYGRFLK